MTKTEIPASFQKTIILSLITFICMCASFNTVSTTYYSDEPELNFDVTEGKIINEFYRKDEIAAHTLLSSGNEPRLIVAFPAGNSGVAIWFDKDDEDVRWSKARNKVGVTETDPFGNIMYGVSWQTTIKAKDISIEQAVLSNVRILRDYLHLRRVPEQIINDQVVRKKEVIWYRKRLDGNSAYKLHVRLENGYVEEHSGKIRFISDNGQSMSLHITAMGGDTPLTPIPVNEIFNEKAAIDPLAQNLFAFLTYEEKLLAGSWRFLTYFGRDTLLSIRLLLPVLNESVPAAGLGSVLNRLAANGEVAHEEDIGEFAVLRSIWDKDKISAHPHYDYKMVDDNYILAPVLYEYLFQSGLRKNQIESFLTQQNSDGIPYGQLILRNFKFVYNTAKPFYLEQSYQNLISLKPDMPVGEWRDSNQGLGHGRYAYNVNAVFVPSALQSIKKFLASGLLDEWLSPESDFKLIEEIEKAWSANASSNFEYNIPSIKATKDLAKYTLKLGLSNEIQLPKNENEVTFYSISLDEDGEQIPVINSDIGFAMLFTNPNTEQINRMLQTTMKPFPAGLKTPVGMLVSNPVYSKTEIQDIFTQGHYHGAVIWSWQQALLLSGINKQLMRHDLKSSTKSLLNEARTALLDVIKSTNKVKTSELWTWSYKGGKFEFEAFGQSSGHKSESNAAQLWSNVYLALPEVYE